jgi:small subunit ribosomal protein S13
MPRLAGIDVPENKKLWVSLTYIYGVGRTNVQQVLKSADLDGDRRVKELNSEEISRLQKVLDTMRLEGDLRKEINSNITRLREITSYRGSRHAKGLPARGQRTRTNARTKRGKRMTIGALKKEALAKVESAKKEKERTAVKAAK